jgi:galactoside 2-L-fucosyltransferase 1/2
MAIADYKGQLSALCVIVVVSYIFLSYRYEETLPKPAVLHETIRSWWASFQSLRVLDYLSNKNDSLSSPAKPIDRLVLPPEPTSVNKSGRYVSMCGGNYDNRRIGNQLFNFAAMLHVARLTNRLVGTLRQHPHGNWLDNWFQVSIARVDNIDKELCPCSIIGEDRGLAYERQMLALPNRTDLVGKSLLVCGWFQSWKYTVGVEAPLRHHLRPLDNISAQIQSFFDSSKPTRWRGLQTYVKVGIHVRAGDIMNNNKFSFGYTIPKRPFFELAMKNVTFDTPLDGGKRRLQFFVTSDSIEWVQKTLNLTSIGTSLNSSSTDIEVTYSTNHSAGFDLITLTKCDVVIMTTGTYGWWGAWLSNAKKIIYYYNWPRPSSSLEGLLVEKISILQTGYRSRVRILNFRRFHLIVKLLFRENDVDLMHLFNIGFY